MNCRRVPGASANGDRRRAQKFALLFRFDAGRFVLCHDRAQTRKATSRVHRCYCHDDLGFWAAASASKPHRRWHGGGCDLKRQGHALPRDSCKVTADTVPTASDMEDPAGSTVGVSTIGTMRDALGSRRPKSGLIYAGHQMLGPHARVSSTRLRGDNRFLAIDTRPRQDVALSVARNSAIHQMQSYRRIP